MTQADACLQMLRQGPKTTGEFIRSDFGLAAEYRRALTTLRKRGFGIMAQRISRGSWKYVLTTEPERRPVPPVSLFLMALWLLACQPAWACEYDALIEKTALAAGVDGKTAILICHAESSGNPQVEGPDGARGLFQLTEKTWSRLTGRPFSLAFDPALNVRVGVQHLSENREAGRIDPRNYASWHNSGVRSWVRVKKRWTVNHPNRIYRGFYRGEKEN